MGATATALVVGGDSAVGRALVARLRADGRRVLATTRRAASAGGERPRLDLSTDLAGWRPPAGTATAYLLAAVTSQRACREHPEATRRVNVEAAVALARACAAAGAFVVLPSTSLVLDGRRPRAPAGDPIAPQSEYARQKAAAEAEVLALSDRAAVLRVPKVLRPEDPLIRGWVEALAAGRPVAPFDDLVTATVPLRLVAEALVRLGERRLAGLWQLSGAEDVTYADIARALARLLGADPGLVRPRSAAAAGLAARPAHAALDSTPLAEALGLDIPPLAAQLAEVFLDDAAAAGGPHAAARD